VELQAERARFNWYVLAIHHDKTIPLSQGDAEALSEASDFGLPDLLRDLIDAAMKGEGS
jgi:hypothetical protein